MYSISVRHNMEMAHRLYLTEGKCQAIHGHSWWVTLTVWGRVNPNGLLEGIDFGDLKALLRGYMDENFDHHLLLNKKDPWSGPLAHSFEHDLVSAKPETGILASLPGLVCFDGDPTTETIAAVIGSTMSMKLSMSNNIRQVRVEVWETAVNNATWTNDERTPRL